MKVIIQIVLLIGFTLSYSLVDAEDAYQMEITLNESHFEAGDDFERDRHLIFVSHYFAPVTTTGHPLAEAAFFERIARVTLSVGPGEVKDGPFEADQFSYKVSVNFLQPQSPVTGQMSYSKTDTEFQFPVIGGFTNERSGFSAGYFVQDTLHLGFGHDRSESKRSIIGVPKVSFKEQSYAINTKWVEKLPNKRAFNLQGSLVLVRFDDPTEEGENRIVSLSGDFYPNRRISLGGGITLNRGDKAGREGNRYFARTRFFLSPSFSIALFYEDFSAQNPDKEDTTFYRLRLSSRF